MLDSKQTPPPSVYLLGDHLDAALAAGEDLLALTLEIVPPSANAGPVELERCQKDFAQFLNRLRALEASLIARVLQARRRAEEIQRPDAHLKPLISLFLSGTVSLLDAVEEFGNPIALAFNTGNDALHFLRGRGLLAPDAAGLPIAGTMAVDETYPVASRVQLGPLMDLVATFLDALDVRFSLYEDDVMPQERPLPAPPSRPVPAAPSMATRRPARLADPPAAKAKSLAAALEALYGPN
jgi:hypothetical protein